MKEEIIYEIKHDHDGAYWHEFEGTLAECHEFMENYQGSDISVLTLKQKYITKPAIKRVVYGLLPTQR
jgi:hypothetical protein